MRKKKRRIRKGRLFILIVFLFLISWGIIKSLSLGVNFLHNLIDKMTEKKEVVSNYKAVVTSNSEKNSNIVEEYFVDGMSTEDYKKSIEKIDDYLDISGKYTKVIFDFNKKYHYADLEEIYKSLALSAMVKIEIIAINEIIILDNE